MKLSLILVALFLSCYVANGQPNMLGKTKTYILANCKVAAFEKEGRQNDTTTYLAFIPYSDVNSGFRFYINKNGICDLFMIQQLKKDMPGTIKSLNESYDKIAADKWISKDYEMTITIGYLKESDYFITSFSSIL